MTDNFAHLHLHTQYSLLDGANKLPDILVQAAALKQPAIAITDHGNLHGAIEFYQAAKEAAIKAIIGCELYVTPVSRHERKTRQQGGGGTYHLTVLCKDMEGYRNLCKLVSISYKEGFYFKPRVDHEVLSQYSKGLIVLSGCMNGEVSEAAQNEDLEEARRRAEFFRSLYGENFFFEVMPHKVHEQDQVNACCADLAKSMGLPIVATNDCHYPTKDDHYAQEVLMCVSMGKLITDPTRYKHEGMDLHLKTRDEMKAGFGDKPWVDEALANTVRIAEMCNLSFDFSKHYMPVYRHGMFAEKEIKQPTQEELVRSMAEAARAGMEKRFEVISKTREDWSDALRAEYEKRLEEEITLIEKMGFAGYFLVVSDFIIWAKEHGVPVGPGRGSAAGSLVAYAMRITDIDPIQHKLLFERFLNPERVSLPDIDVDFCINGRDRVIKYVVEKYGAENVAQIATFGTMKAKAALKDVGRVLGISFAETNRIADLVPAPRQGFDFSLEEAIKMEPKLKEYADNEGKELVTLALKLEGLTRHSSTHAAGVVISDRPLTDYLPVMVDKDGNDVTQYSMSYVEKVGLVKFDFLGLKTLTVIHTALKIIEESQGKKLELDLLPMNDRRTYQILCAGNTTGVFQLESSGITEMTMRLKPNSFDDLVAILALYRPGPLDAGMVDHYIERKHGRQPVTYLHPMMKDVLCDTYGIILYQEQIMQLARVLAGYSLGEADLLRRAMGKKKPEEMAKQRDRFMSGTAKNGIAAKLAGEIFDQMETFARYGFNRSHSAAYALISFHTAYLKAHYPVEFMAALMSHEMSDSDKTLKNINECRKQKIKILPPDVNESLAGFSARGASIRFGLEAIKGIGEKAVQSIIDARAREGRFKDLEDLLERVELHAVNKKVLESLIKCGAFDFSGFSRAELISRYEDCHAAAQSLQREKNTNQISLFGGKDVKPSILRRTTNRPEWPVNQRLAYEREALGFYISGHPLEKFALDLGRMGTVSTADLRTKKKGDRVRVGGVVTALKLKNTKKGDRYATFLLEDWLGAVETIVWPDTYKKIANQIIADDPVLVSGRLDISEERCSLIADEMESIIAIRDKTARQGLIVLKETDNVESHMPDLMSVLQRYQGKCPVKVKLDIGGAEVSMVLRDQKQAPVCVSPSETLCEEVEQLFGRPVLSFV